MAPEAEGTAGKTGKSGRKAAPRPDDRTMAVEAFLGLLATRSYADISLTDIAEAAGLKPSALRQAVSGKSELLAAFAGQVDAAVLDDRDDSMFDQPPRDRLFDVLMTRLDALAPHKSALTQLRKDAMRDPALAMCLNGIAVRSQGWMLAAAGVSIPGIKGRLVQQGLAVSFARVLETFLEEEDESLPRTMAALDRELDRGEDWLRRLGAVERVTRPVACGLIKLAGKAMSRRKSRRSEAAPGAVSEAGGEAAAQPV